MLNIVGIKRSKRNLAELCHDRCRDMIGYDVLASEKRKLSRSTGTEKLLLTETFHFGGIFLKFMLTQLMVPLCSNTELLRECRADNLECNNRPIWWKPSTNQRVWSTCCTGFVLYQEPKLTTLHSLWHWFILQLKLILSQRRKGYYTRWFTSIYVDMQDLPPYSNKQTVKKFKIIAGRQSN